jgi:hypothetical protein
MPAFVQHPKATQETSSAKTPPHDRTSPAQSHDADAILHFQRTVGNQAAQRLLAVDTLAAKNTSTANQMATNAPGDQYEQEAVRVSQQLMRTSEPQQRVGAWGRADCGHELVQLKSAVPSGVSSADAPASVHDVLNSPGHPLDAETRTFMGPRFGKDFSDVRVHSDARAVESADAVQARAFTVGHHIVFAAGEYAPGTSAGRALIAHELAHVIQQSSGADDAREQGTVLLQREPRGPTYGNLPREAPALGSSREIVRLKNVGGTWKEVGPRYTRTARGNYDFVVKDGEIFAVKAKRTPGAIGHTEAARGERVNWAGQVEFEAGQVRAWNDGSGHYRPISSMRQPAVQAGLPDDRFVQHPETAPRPRPIESAPQLPVEQPATQSRTPGEPPKVGPGPPRMEEFEERYGKPPAATSTEGHSAATTAALGEEAGSVLKVEGRGATALGKIGTGAGWVADFFMPGPQDALLLMVQFAMTYAEAQEAARAEGLRSGFGQGLCAGLLRLSRRWVRENLAPRVVSGSVASEVAATTGYREKGVVQGLAAGLSFAERLSAEQRRALLNEAVSAMRVKGEDVRLRDWWERGYTASDIIDLSVALAPRVDEILEQARKNEELRQAAAAWERIRQYGPLAPIAQLFE